MNHTSLPLLEETDIASRDEARKLTVKRSENAVVVKYAKISIRDDFNWRRKKNMSDADYDIKLGIPELAEGIYTSCGPDDALVGDLLKDGTFVIMEGERRYRALTFLINRGDTVYPNGKPIAEVEVLLNARTTTELDRIRKIVTSQEKLSLTQMDKAYGYLKLKEEPYKLSNEKIAEMFRISRQTVDNYIAATKLPEDVQDRIDSGEENITNALKVVRENKKPNLAIVDMETGMIHEEGITTIPPTYNSDDDQHDRLGKEEANTPPITVENDKAHDAESKSRETDGKFKDPRRAIDGWDALGKVNDQNQKIDGEMDIEQAIKKLDKMYVLAGQLPNNVKQAKDDLKGGIHFCQELIKQGLDKIKRAPSAVE